MQERALKHGSVSLIEPTRDDDVSHPIDPELPGWYHESAPSDELKERLNQRDPKHSDSDKAHPIFHTVSVIGVSVGTVALAVAAVAVLLTKGGLHLDISRDVACLMGGLFAVIVGCLAALNTSKITGISGLLRLLGIIVVSSGLAGGMLALGMFVSHALGWTAWVV